MKLYFDKLYKDDRINELSGICIPVKKGALSADELSSVKIFDCKRPLPVQAEVTSTWEDGSARYIFAHFLADLPGNDKKQFDITFSGEKSYEALMAEAAPLEDIEGKIHLTWINEVITVSNGTLSFSVADNSDQLFSSFSYMGKDISKDNFTGPLVRIDGEELETVFDSWKAVKEGEILTVLEGKGRFLSKRESAFSGEGIKFEIRISVTAGKPWLDMGFRFINCTDGNIKPDDIIFQVKASREFEPSKDSPVPSVLAVDSTGCGDTKGTSISDDIINISGIRELPDYDITEKDLSGDAPVRSIVGRSNYKTDFKIGQKGQRVENIITAEMLEKEANEHFAEVLYGTFFADFTDPKRNFGVCATVFQAFQNFPKAVRSDEKGLTVFLLPDQELISKHSNALPVVFASGMAREQRFLLHFHDAMEPVYELDNRSLIYQMPDKPYIDPMEFGDALVMPDVFLPVCEQNPEVEAALIDRADNHVRCYGMLNFGDGPDPGYTAQGRGGGRLVWTNNEYDYPHAMYTMYARTGIRRMLDYANTAAYHWMDVDVCHYSPDPMKQGGQWEHTKNHTGGSDNGHGSEGEMVCSHQWVEGLLDLYHFTADERALDTAIGIGENVLRLLDTPMYQVPGEATARETGWALRTLTALFLETHEKRWMEKSEWIISQFREWNNRYGKWMSPYSDNTTIRVGFMISVAIGSLARYYRVFPGEELKKLILDAVDDLVDNYMTPQGLFIYKELPSLSRNNTNTLLLEAMAIGYELTGDTSYLERGMFTFKRTITSQAHFGGEKRIVEDAVLVGSGAPKSFAQSFFPLTSFYVKSAGAKKLLL